MNNLGQAVVVFRMNGDQVECHVEKVDTRIDVIYLVPSAKIEVKTINVESTYEGEPYIQLGFSNPTQEMSPICVAIGNISSNTYDANLHVLGSAGSAEGD